MSTVCWDVRFETHHQPPSSSVSVKNRDSVISFLPDLWWHLVVLKLLKMWMWKGCLVFHIPIAPSIWLVYLPGPFKGCQMVAKGCQFILPWGLIGTPWKVLVPTRMVGFWIGKSGKIYQSHGCYPPQTNSSPLKKRWTVEFPGVCMVLINNGPVDNVSVGISRWIYQISYKIRSTV